MLEHFLDRQFIPSSLMQEDIIALAEKMHNWSGAEIENLLTSLDTPFRALENWDDEMKVSADPIEPVDGEGAPVSVDIQSLFGDDAPLPEVPSSDPIVYGREYFEAQIQLHTAKTSSEEYQKYLDKESQLSAAIATQLEQEVNQFRDLPLIRNTGNVEYIYDDRARPLPEPPKHALPPLMKKRRRPNHSYLPFQIETEEEEEDPMHSFPFEHVVKVLAKRKMKEELTGLPLISPFEAAQSDPTLAPPFPQAAHGVKTLQNLCQFQLMQCEDAQIAAVLAVIHEIANLSLLRETLLERVSFESSDLGVANLDDLEAIHLLRLCGPNPGVRWR